MSAYLVLRHDDATGSLTQLGTVEADETREGVLAALTRVADEQGSASGLILQRADTPQPTAERLRIWRYPRRHERQISLHMMYAYRAFRARP